MQVFKIDHPTTQALKRQRLRGAGLDTPVNVHYVQADFEVESVADALSQILPTIRPRRCSFPGSV